MNTYARQYGRVILLMLTAVLCACTPAAPTQALFAQVPPLLDAPTVSQSQPLSLPADHRAHPQHQLEWWYFTATLDDASGEPYAMQYTLFRLRLPSSSSHWHNDQLWMAHVALRSREQRWFRERLARGGVGNAGQLTTPFRLFLDDWQWQSEADDAPFPATLSLALDTHTHIMLNLSTRGPYVKHGEQGYSIKTAEEDYRSYYYSQPFVDVHAVLTDGTKTTSLKGQGWYDHEWTSHLAGPDALGWDWFSLHLDDGRKLMVFRMRTAERPPYITGSLISRTGELVTLAPEDISLAPVSRKALASATATVATEWRLGIAKHALDLSLQAFIDDQWNPAQLPYYEGRVEVSGSHTGNGFMELTGAQDIKY